MKKLIIALSFLVIPNFALAENIDEQVCENFESKPPLSDFLDNIKDQFCSIVDVQKIFDGGSNAILAIITGFSEGNRTLDGGKKRSFYGHRDPGNGAGNVGSFSRNGTNLTPEAADRDWLGRLKSFYKIYESRVLEMGLNPRNPILLFTAMDLFTQAPAAAKGWSDRTRGIGFLGLLSELRGKEITWESMIPLRVRSFYNSNGRKETVFSHAGLVADQLRRTNALKKAAEHLLKPVSRFCIQN